MVLTLHYFDNSTVKEFNIFNSLLTFQLTSTAGVNVLLTHTKQKLPISFLQLSLHLHPLFKIMAYIGQYKIAVHLLSQTLQGINNIYFNIK